MNKVQFYMMYQYETGSVARTKIIYDLRSAKVKEKHGLRDCKEMVDQYSLYPEVLWCFAKYGFMPQTTHGFHMVVANRGSGRDKTWEEPLDNVNTVKGTIKELKSIARGIIGSFNDSLRPGETPRVYKGLVFSYVNLDGGLKSLKL